MLATQPPIFVYGTLRQGQGNCGLITPFARRIERGVTQGRMYSLGRFPAVVAGRERIAGEVIWVNPTQYDVALQQLDWLEGVDPRTCRGILAPKNWTTS